MQRVFRLEDLDRRVAAVAVVDEAAVAVVVDAAPAAALDVVVRVVVAVFGMHPTEEEVAGRAALGGRDPLRHRAGLGPATTFGRLGCVSVLPPTDGPG